MTEKDLTDLGFIKQIQDACCDPQVYTFYLQVGSSIPFTTQVLLMMTIGQ